MRFRNLLAAVTLGSAAVLAAAPAQAQYADDMIHAGTLEVPINKSQVVTADRAIDRAMVGNADIADVVPISDRSIYVLGKGFGTTSLTLYDRNNAVIAVMDISVGPDVDGLRSQISSLVPDEQIDAQLSNGQVILSGMVTDAGAASRAARIASAYAGENVINLLSVGGSQQVMLEVTFAEVNRQVGESLNFDVSGVGPGGDGFSFGDGVGGGYGILRSFFGIGDVDLSAFVDVLERKGLARTLAEPTLIALSGEPASFLAGGEFPVPVLQGGGDAADGITVEFKPFGISLGFTPTVLGGKVINLVVEPEVSSIDPTASVTVNGLVVPGLQTRRASTTLELRDGESFAIAGLLQRDQSTTIRQLPILGSIPILGTLFRSTSYQEGQTELLIVVTPRLVKPIRPDQVRLPTDRVPAPNVYDTILGGDEYQPRKLPPAAPTATTEDPYYEF